MKHRIIINSKLWFFSHYRLNEYLMIYTTLIFLLNLSSIKVTLNTQRTLKINKYYSLHVKFTDIDRDIIRTVSPSEKTHRTIVLKNIYHSMQMYWENAICIPIIRYRARKSEMKKKNTNCKRKPVFIHKLYARCAKSMEKNISVE